MRLLSAVLVFTACAGAAHAQQAPISVVLPNSITVGDVFHAAIRVDLPAGTTLVAPDSLALPTDVENAGRPVIRIDTVGDLHRTTVVFPLTAWRPGSYDLPPTLLRVTDASGARDIDVTLPSFTIRSVLPADTAGVEPKPAKDVLGANRLWWPLLLLALLIAAALFALWYWWKKRRAAHVDEEPIVMTPRIHPRAHALELLEALRREGLLERGELKTYYARLTEILRRYAGTLDPAWGVDLTTSELNARVRRAHGGADGLELIRILGTADLVKFARATLPRAAAAADLDAAQGWVERFAPAAPDDGVTQRVA